MGDTCCNNACQSVPANSKWLKIAFALVILTILYNVAEGLIAVWFGLEADSISLVGFGIDSIIEVSAAVLVLWRLLVQLKQTGDEAVERTETTVHRFVGVTFFLLATYIAYEAASTLWKQQAPDISIVGIILAILSLLIMPLLAWGKIRAAKEISSSALQSEAKETIACSILSLILLVGLAANALLGWWWADPVAGLCMVPWLVKEGTAGIKGEGCCG
jgi:divalent metal cation (Fe/Co/Zn/Cd) transporter